MYLIFTSVLLLLEIPFKEMRANNCFCEGFRGDIHKGFRGLAEIAEAAPAVSLRSQKPLIFTDIRKLPFRGKIIMLKF
jgi:hypothetical protein